MFKVSFHATWGFTASFAVGGLSFRSLYKLNIHFLCWGEGEREKEQGEIAKEG
jgi:hypothetical protein